jgi:hypothetical protein
MKSVTTARFRKAYDALPVQVQHLADKAYAIWEENPLHPSLHFKQIQPDPPVYSVRVSLGYRALGVKEGDTIVWFWIGSHADYNELLKAL